MQDIRSNLVWFIDKTFQGAWAIHGQIGYRQYMGYSKSEAIRKYKQECRQTLALKQPSYKTK